MAKEILPNKNPEYWANTVKCPHCYGRGRIPKEGYTLTEDVYETVYEEEQAIAEVEEILIMAYRDGIDNNS